MSNWFPATILVLALRLIPVPINTKKTCKDAKKSLTGRQAGMIDAFPGSILPIYIKCRPRSHRSNNTKSFFSPLLRHCLPAKEWLSVLVWGGCVKERQRWCVEFTCQRWTECPVSWSSAESQGGAVTRCQRACLWTLGTSVKLWRHHTRW